MPTFARILFCLLAVSLCISSHARSLDDIVESGVIEIAVYNDFPPYSFIDEQGRETGLDIDIGRHIAQALNVEPKWLWFDADETLGDDLRNVIWKGRKIDKKNRRPDDAGSL